MIFGVPVREVRSKQQSSGAKPHKRLSVLTYRGTITCNR